MINERTAKKYCSEDISLIENYELAVNDTTQTWQCHHRGEVLSCGRFSPNDLKKFGLYYKRPAAELIFLTPFAHRQLHNKGVTLSKATKKAISDGLKGHSVSEETKKAMSEAHKGVPLSEATKKAMSEAHKGIPKSEAHKKALSEVHSKKILQLTKSGEFVREWPSAKEANRELGVSRCTICCCCSGKRKSAGGFIWKYVK